MKSFLDILLDHVKQSNSRLCVGLDIDADRIDSILSPSFQDLKDYVFKVVNATLDFSAAYKINFAFFERYGSKGFQWLEEVVDYIDSKRLMIADAKRGDISNSARHYASAIFDHFGFDAVTVNPYMGRDAIKPFAENPEKGAFVICLTSNVGAKDLQLQRANGQLLYRKVIEMVKDLNKNNNCGLVVGATQKDELAGIREAAGDMPLLIPGIGAQGGDLELSVREGNRKGIALINVSRAILYAGQQNEESIRKTAKEYCERINAALEI